jgi:hypothetical protein
VSEVTLVPVDPTPDDVQYLEDRISEFNSSATGIADGELLAFFVRERGRIVAGISGNTWGGTCEVRQFWWTSRTPPWARYETVPGGRAGSTFQSSAVENCSARTWNR